MGCNRRWHTPCLEADPEVFFPERGGSTKEARAYCARCPVAGDCLAYALENHEAYGIWATSERGAPAAQAVVPASAVQRFLTYFME